MSTMCCSRDPSWPDNPGGLPQILEWSSHGGAVDMMIIIPGLFPVSEQNYPRTISI